MKVNANIRTTMPQLMLFKCTSLTYPGGVEVLIARTFHMTDSSRSSFLIFIVDRLFSTNLAHNE